MATEKAGDLLNNLLSANVDGLLDPSSKEKRKKHESGDGGGICSRHRLRSSTDGLFSFSCINMLS